VITAERGTVVVVEGISDQVAIETVARRCGRDLAAERVQVVPIDGAHAVGRFLRALSPDTAVRGMYDAGEEHLFREALGRTGIGSPTTRTEMESLGFFACIVDLEDELVRAIGTAGIEGLLAAEGDLERFRTLQKQPAWRGRPVEHQLRRFIAAGSRRKLRYARLIIEALDVDRVPRPLAGVLASI
jgi:hypothetical protein